VDLLRSEASRCDLEPELRAPRTGLPYAVGASIAEGRKRPVMLLTSDSAFLFHIAELETAARENLPLAAWSVSITSGASRSASTNAPSPAVAAAGRALEQGRALRQDRRGFGCHGEYIEKEDEMGRPSSGRSPAAKTAVVHVCIDPKANSEEMPKYDEFRTWYAEGTQ